MKYIQSHLNNPGGYDTQDVVITQFVVERTGDIGEVKVVRSAGRELDAEAVRVIRSLPAFTPGRQNGEAVAVWYTLPIRFNNAGSLEFGERYRDTPYQSDVDTQADTTIYRSVEQMPRFPGGEAALMKYLKSHLRNPRGDYAQRVVITQFVVDRTGRVGQVKVVRSGGRELDAEAVRVIRSLPAFTPGRQNGRSVSVWYTLPVSFD
jgi:TonB family protein